MTALCAACMFAPTRVASLAAAGAVVSAFWFSVAVLVDAAPHRRDQAGRALALFITASVVAPWISRALWDVFRHPSVQVVLAVASMVLIAAAIVRTAAFLLMSGPNEQRTRPRVHRRAEDFEIDFSEGVDRFRVEELEPFRGRRER